MTGSALRLDRASVLFQDAAAHSESEPGAAGPGTESRVKDVRQVSERNARPGVPHYDFHTVALRLV
jgi:hypothetical protein